MSRVTLLRLGLTGTVALALQSAAHAQETGQPYIVKDIYPGGAQSGGESFQDWSLQSDLTVIDGKLYFAAPTQGPPYVYCNKGICMGEPWVSDGTPEGTLVLKEIYPGPEGSRASGFTACGDRVVFQASENPWRVSASPWITDGTPAGTRPATETDLLPGCSTDRRPALGGRYFYPWYDEAHGAELWVSDGKEEDGELLKDIAPGPLSSNPQWLTVFQGRLYFAAWDGVAEAQTARLWVSDGTPEGTVAIEDTFGAASLASTGDRLFCIGWAPAGGLGILAVDGTAGAAQVIWETDPRESSYAEPVWLTAAGSRLFFAARPCCNEVTLLQLWTSDGTVAGTLPITEIFPGLNQPRDLVPLLRFASLGNRYFSIDASGAFGSADLALWATDLTPEGTYMIKDLDGPASSRPERLTSFQDKVIFSAEDADHGREVWISDGRPAGTTLLTDLFPGMAGFYASPFTVVWDDQAFFSDGTSLWVSEGAPETTSAVTSSASCGLGYGLTLFRDRLLFSGCDDEHGHELWTSDGTAEGTRLLKDIAPGRDSSYPDQFRVSCERLFITATAREGSDRSLWVTDGTPEGTVPWSGDICQETTEAYLVAGSDAEHGNEPWISDGTEAGTRLFIDLLPGPASSDPAWFVKAGDRLYFSAFDPEHGRELWTSDGTAGGTRLAFDILPGEVWSDPQELAVAGSRLFFTAHDSVHGRELWVLPLDGPFPRLFHRGDPNLSGTTDISDAIAIFGHLFLGDPATLACRESADVQNDAAIDISDGIALLTWLFGGGPAPAPPGPAMSPCGVDPDAPGSAGDLGCAEYALCE